MGSSASKEPERDRRTVRPTAGKEGAEYYRQISHSSSSSGPTGTPLQRINSNVALYRGSDNSIETTPSNTFYEHVFLVTMGRTTGVDLPETCVLVSQSSKRKEKNSQGLLTDNSLGEAVYERLMIQNPSVKLVRSSPGGTWYTPVGAARDHPADEACSLKYMYHCFVRWKTLKRDAKFSSMDKELESSKEVILQQTQMCLQQPELFAKQNVYHQLVGICIDAGDALLDKASAIHEFIMGLVPILEAEGCLAQCLCPVLKLIRTRLLTEYKLMHAAETSQHANVLKLFSNSETLAKLFMEFTAPDDWSKGSAYERTLLGSLLAMNPCPRGSEEECEFFSRNIMDAGTHETHTTIMFIWQRLNSICDDIHRMLKSIIKLSTELRHQVLYWIGRCLEANRGKTELWSAHDVEIYQKDFASDGFCLNLSQVLLQLCEPFSRPNSDMLLKVKATYCRVTPASDQEAKDMCVHARGLDKEKTFVPYTEEQRLPQEKQYHFISECFFLTNQALHIAYSIVYKLYKLAGSIGRLKSLVDMMKEGSGYTRIVVLIKMQLNRELCWYYNMKAALTGFGLVKSCLNFHIATASWLVQIASRDEVTDFREIALPLANEIPKILSYVPEFILSNFTMFISSLEVFSALDVIKENKECLHQFMTVILVYMGSSRRLVNSNMRAQLAEAVESFVPELNEPDGTYKLSASGYEDSVFKEHRLISHLAEAVLNVFVSIEMTGQSVDDERKFSYRKSMHKLLQYMWKIPAHKDAIKAVSKRAMTEMNNTEAPLFLRFVNLLINDAIFLLDEGLAHMRDIRDQELERDKGNWNKLSDEQMREKESGLRHLCMLGRYRNIMANHTIYTLEILTREIRDIFCHQVMVDRIAGMLNYFLLELVGPKQTNYKVKDRKEHEFKPEQIVADIAHIYVYLGDNAQFCMAVLEESRSFSERLFTDAVKVLQKIGIAPEFVVKFSQLHEKLKSLQCSRQQEEEALGEAPEDFLDPIMGTLMEDPVILPETKTNIDRSVINRHLLSDQRDPFTKSPLSMNMVIPNLELKQRIEQWKLERLGHS